jgi:plastocyanin
MGMNIVLNQIGDNGNLSGVITWTGPAPTYKIDTSADPVCSQRNPNLLTENYRVTNGKVANVFVYIEDGTTTDGWKLSDLMFDVPIEEVILDQSGCRFVPHVVGVQVNQTLSVTNSDPTTHNVHFTPTNNPDWNQTQPSGAAPLTHKFSYSEVMVPVKNNQHPWMKAYVGVLKHPFFAVTSEDGSFQIRGVPPGTYTLVAWHEATGLKGEGIITRTVVTVKSKTNVSAANISSLKVGKDKSLSQETSTFRPTDLIYAVATISNAQGNVKARAQLVIEDVPGQEAGPVPGVEKTVALPGSGTATYTFSPPPAGWPKGRYKVEVILTDDNGEQKDQTASAFSVSW